MEWTSRLLFSFTTNVSVWRELIKKEELSCHCGERSEVFWCCSPSVRTSHRASSGIWPKKMTYIWQNSKYSVLNYKRFMVHRFPVQECKLLMNNDEAGNNMICTKWSIKFLNTAIRIFNAYLCIFSEHVATVRETTWFSVYA